MKRARVLHEDVTRGVQALADASVALVIADPPYDIAVGNAHWDKVKNYMPFAREWLSQCVRVLRPGGALFLYGSPERMHIARMSVMLVDELGMRHVQDTPWVYTQGARRHAFEPHSEPLRAHRASAQAATRGWRT